MSVATCDACGKDSHVYLEVKCDGALNSLIGKKYYCEACGAMVGRAILDVTLILRWKKNADT